MQGRRNAACHPGADARRAACSRDRAAREPTPRPDPRVQRLRSRPTFLSPERTAERTWLDPPHIGAKRRLRAPGRDRSAGIPARRGGGRCVPGSRGAPAVGRSPPLPAGYPPSRCRRRTRGCPARPGSAPRTGPRIRRHDRRAAARARSCARSARRGCRSPPPSLRRRAWRRRARNCAGRRSARRI